MFRVFVLELSPACASAHVHTHTSLERGELDSKRKVLILLIRTKILYAPLKHKKASAYFTGCCVQHVNLPVVISQDPGNGSILMEVGLSVLPLSVESCKEPEMYWI